VGITPRRSPTVKVRGEPAQALRVTAYRRGIRLNAVSPSPAIASNYRPLIT